MFGGPEPAVKCSGALDAGAVDGAVGPAVEERADEALGFAVGLWAARAGAQVADPELAAGDRVQRGDVGAAIVGEHAFDGDSVAGGREERAPRGSERGARGVVGGGPRGGAGGGV